MTENLTAKQIHARLTSADNVYGPPGTSDMDEWGKVFAELFGKYSRDALIAWTQAQADFDSTATFAPDDLDDEMHRTYRQQWETPGAFVEGRIVEEQKDYGDDEERKGFEKFVRMFGAHVDWDQAADDVEITEGYTLITLDPESSVYAFEMDA